MTDTYIVLTTPTTTHSFPVRAIRSMRVMESESALGVSARLRPSDRPDEGALADFATAIPTGDPAEALRIATQALTDAIRTGQSVRADVGCVQLAVKSNAPDCEVKTASDVVESVFGVHEASPGDTRSAVRNMLDMAHEFAADILWSRCGPGVTIEHCAPSPACDSEPKASGGPLGMGEVGGAWPQRYAVVGSVNDALASVAGTLRIAADIISSASRELR